MRIIRQSSFRSGILSITTALPERGEGFTAQQILRAFKREVLDLIKKHGPDLRGATVQLSGPNLVANALFAGFAFAKAGVHELEQEQQGGVWVKVAAHDDPDAPIPITWEPGMIVRARLFGHEAEARIIGLGTGYRSSRRVQVKAGNQSAWIDEADVIAFVRYEARR